MAKVLLVENIDDSREYFAQILTGNGYEVIEASDGREALDLAARERPDLILMELSLPEMDGWEAACRLKASPTLQAIPVIAVTGPDTWRDEQRAIAAGCDGYLCQPVLPRELVGRIERQLQSL